jgi:Transposase IS4
MREVSGPQAFATQRIRKDTVLSAFRLLVDENMMRHIQRCTETEARERSGDESWSVSLDELDAFIGILYARGVYGASKLDLKSLWSQPWSPNFFAETMSRDRFTDIMRFLRFDIEQTRSLRLQTDKFALASEIWNSWFIDKSILCYKAGYQENKNITGQL